MAHHCHMTNCNVSVPPEMFACRRHWFMVPKPLRDAIWRTYRDGQCDTLDPSSEYCQAARAAVIAVAKREGIEPDTSLYDVFETIANARENGGSSTPPAGP